jgi:hypothetical protein
MSPLQVSSWRPQNVCVLAGKTRTSSLLGNPQLGGQSPMLSSGTTGLEHRVASSSASAQNPKGTPGELAVRTGVSWARIGDHLSS